MIIAGNTIDSSVPAGLIPVDDRRFTDNGFKVEIFVTSGRDGRTTSKVDVTELVESIDWNDSLDQAAVQGTLTLYDPPNPTDNEKRTLVNIPKGSRIRLSVLNDVGEMTEVGRFVVWEKERSSRTDPVLRLAFYDMLVYLLKSEDFFLYQKDPKKKAFKKGWTASQITRDVCKRYGIPVGSIPTAKHRIPLVKIDGGSVYELLLKVWTEERLVTGNRFIIRCEKDKLRVIRKQAQVTMYQVAEGENLINSTFTDSLEGMYTAVTLVADQQSNSSGVKQQSTDRTTDAGDTRQDVYSSTGGGWKREATSFFTPGTEPGPALAYGDPNSNDVWGFGEAAKNQSSSGPFDAMGKLAGKTVIEVRYKGKTIQVPKVDVGAGGPGVEGLPRVMDLTVAAWDALGIPQSAGVVPIEWRLLNSAASRGNPANTPAVISKRQDTAKVKKYGYLHKIINLDKPLTGKDAQKAAKTYLQNILRENLEGTVTCYMMPHLRAGAPVFVNDKGSQLVGKFYCSDVRHSITASGCTTEIGLNWLDVVPSTKLTDEDKGIVKKTEGGGGGSTIAGSPGTIQRILPTSMGTSDYGYSDPEGQGGRHLADDWFGPAGTQVSTPEDGVIDRVKPDPQPGRQATGQVYGGSVYIKCASGRYWVLRHLQNVMVRTGQQVTAGEKVAEVKDWGGGSHVHVELYVGGYDYEGGTTAQDPWKFFRDRGIS